MRPEPRPFELYRHFEGDLYQIMAIAYDAGDGRRKVVYQALYGDYKVYVRDLVEFMDETDRNKYPQAGQQYRFERVQTNRAVEQEDSAKIVGAAFAKTVGKEAEMAIEKENGTKTADAREKTDETEETDEIASLDPAVVEYLDAEGYEERLNILTGVHHRITAEMLATMAVVSDVELEEGSVEEQYQSLKYCLATKQKFEKIRVF